MTWLLYIVLTTGESGTLQLSEHICQRIPLEISRGISAGLVTEDGRDIEIARAACLGPVDHDPCSMGEPTA